MIRKATKNDASRLAEILIFSKRMAYRSIFKNDKVSFNEMQVFPLALAYINTPGILDNIFVFDDEFVKGMIKLSAENNIAEIVELYVDPFFQKQNIGSVLLDFGEKYLLNIGFSNVILWVLEKNKNARQFYEKQGFVQTIDKKLETGTEEYIIKYQKSLK